MSKSKSKVVPVKATKVEAAIQAQVEAAGEKLTARQLAKVKSMLQSVGLTVAEIEVKEERRGRPPRFQGEQLENVKSLLRRFGLTKTRKILMARAPRPGVSKKEAALYELRNKGIFAEPTKVSMPTLWKLAQEHAIPQTIGRPADAA